MPYCNFPSSNSYRCDCGDCRDPTGRKCQKCKEPADIYILVSDFRGSGDKHWYCNKCKPAQ